MAKLSIAQIEKKINDIESSYYKGNRQTEEWWRITGNVHPTDRRLWSFYHNLKNKRENSENN
tara:strand:- start:279 stop:464 length:186 start_codon:yes stop_codon:yes gene_type:complete